MVFSQVLDVTPMARNESEACRASRSRMIITQITLGTAILYDNVEFAH
jgi:hypothetical protein